MLKSGLEYIFSAANHNPSKTAFIHFKDYSKPNFVTYGEFQDLLLRFAGLVSVSLQEKKPVVSFAMDNHFYTQIVLWGTQAVGIVNPINPQLSANEISNIMIACNSDFLFLDEKYCEKAHEIENKTQKQVFIVREDFLTLLSKQSSVEPVEIDENSIAAYFHTGGTTGLPKIVPLSHKNCISNSIMIRNVVDSDSNDVFLCGLPLFHVNAIHITGLVPFLTCGTIVLPYGGFKNKIFFENFWNVVEKFGISLFSSVPTILADLLSLPIKENQNLTSLRYAIAGAAPLSVDLFERFEKATGLKILEGYGLTESTCAVCCNPITGPRKVGSVGIPSWGCDVRIANIDKEKHKILNDCSKNESGNILIRGSNVFSGYLNPRDNQGVWYEEWFDTGDLGKLDDDGFLWITGRSKDLIIRGGHNIDPKNIEEIISKHPSVKLASAVGKRDERLGEVPVVFVSLIEECSATESELLDFFRSSGLEKVSIPTKVFFLKQFPLTAVGKIFKPELRKIAEASF